MVFTQVGLDPQILPPFLQLGTATSLTVQDASAFAGEGELLSFQQLQARCASVRQVRGCGQHVWEPVSMHVPWGVASARPDKHHRGMHAACGYYMLWA